jgi:hypothetical protein
MLSRVPRGGWRTPASIICSLWVPELSWLRHTIWFTSNETLHYLPFERDRDPQLGFRKVSSNGVELSMCSALTT